MNYPGSKGGPGVFQKIISLMPSHDVYIETHLGGGNILLKKRPAASSIAIEIDSEVLKAFIASNGDEDLRVQYVNSDAGEYLQAYRWTGRELVYCDPPYPFSCRRSKRQRYRYEYSDRDHQGFLDCVLQIPAFVMISSYANRLYDTRLSHWHSVEFTARTRGCTAVEKLWMNFDPDRQLKHEYTFTGWDFRERERIKRKARRWVSNLAMMDPDERNFILAEIRERFARDYGHHFRDRAFSKTSSSHRQ